MTNLVTKASELVYQMDNDQLNQLNRKYIVVDTPQGSYRVPGSMLKQGVSA